MFLNLKAPGRSEEIKDFRGTFVDQNYVSKNVKYC